MKKTMLVTGGVGFIGTNFVRYIYNKYPDYRIIILDLLTYAGNIENIPEEGLKNKRIEFWYGNVMDGDIVSSLVSKVDTVVHFAAETHVTRSIYNNRLFFETDVLGTQCITNIVSRCHNVERFIHISTSEVYGTAETEYMTEDHPLKPLSPYSSAKVGADRLVYSYWSTYDIPAIIIRPFNNYGCYQHLEKVIPRFITSCIMNEPLTVHGNGKASRDWIYVMESCEALDKVLHVDINKVKGEVINIGTGRSTEILEIAEMICGMMNKPKSLISFIEDRPGQVIRHTASIEKAQRIIDWEPKIKFEEGLAKTIDWYVNNEKWWKKQVWMRQIEIMGKNGQKMTH